MLIARFDSTTDSLVFISSTAILFASRPNFFGIELAEVYPCLSIYVYMRIVHSLLCTDISGQPEQCNRVNRG